MVEIYTTLVYEDRELSPTGNFEQNLVPNLKMAHAFSVLSLRLHHSFSMLIEIYCDSTTPP